MNTLIRLGFLTLACSALFGATLFAQSGSPMQGLEKLKDFQTKRASSCDPNWKSGNADARPIPPGGVLTVAELEGQARSFTSGAPLRMMIPPTREC